MVTLARILGLYKLYKPTLKTDYQMILSLAAPSSSLVTLPTTELAFQQIYILLPIHHAHVPTCTNVLNRRPQTPPLPPLEVCHGRCFLTVMNPYMILRHESITSQVLEYCCRSHKLLVSAGFQCARTLYQPPVAQAGRPMANEMKPLTPSTKLLQTLPFTAVRSYIHERSEFIVYFIFNLTRSN